MTPFDINPDNDAGHTIDQDDLIAFHLHELTPPQERALHRVLRTNPALQAESIAIASTLRAFPKQEPALPLDAAALDRHWQALRNSLPTLVPAAIPTRSLFPRWVFPTLAASALAATALILMLHHTPHTTVATTTHNVTSPSNSISPISSVPPIEAVPTTNSVQLSKSVAPPSISHPLLHHALAQPHPTSASISPNPLPMPPSTSAPTPPLTLSSSYATSPSSTTIATTQQATRLTPTFTPIIQTHGHARTHHDHTTDITVAALANLSIGRSFISTTGTGASAVVTPYSQTTSPTLGVLASFHQQLRPWLGYRITASHSEPSFQYVTSSGSENNVAEQAYEFTGAYVVQGPHRRRLSTSAEAGAGVLDFHPKNPISILGVTTTLRPAGVIGISAEFALTSHLAIHAGYRALLYKSPPAYLTSNFTIPPSGNLTFSSEPVVGLTYRFHPTSE